MKYQKKAHIYAWEGPAGSGKSTAKAAFVAANPFVLDQVRPTLPRDQGPEMGTWSSGALDYSSVLRATVYQAQVAVDRFMLSRWVYRYIESGVWSNMWYPEMSRSFRGLKNMAVHEAKDRWTDGRIFVQPTVEVTVLLPTVDELEARRTQSGKTYPFSAELELLTYERIAHELINAPLLGMQVTIER